MSKGGSSLKQGGQSFNLVFGRDSPDDKFSVFELKKPEELFQVS